jgi:hypothetical protein
MRTRPLLATAAAAVALTVAAPLAAQAKTTETIDKFVYDSTPQVTAGSWHIDGLTHGEIGPFLDVTVTAVDGTLPTDPRAVERVRVDAVLTLAPGETLTVHAKGSAEAPAAGGTPSVFASFRKKDLTYDGTAHKKAKLVGNGFISAGGSFLGYQASFSATVSW